MKIAATISQTFISLLTPYGEIGPELAHLIQTSIMRTLEAKMIIEGGLSSHNSANPESPLFPMDFQVAPEINKLIEKTKTLGLAATFLEIIDAFSSAMIEMAADPTQKAQATAWRDQGLRGSFLMTDPGGPALGQWHSTVQSIGNERHLKVDKIHGIQAHKLGYATVLVRQDKSPVPMMYTLSPTDCKNLHQTPIGEAFLDGTLQLGNVSGHVVVSDSQRLKGGGITGTHRFLSYVRPRFIKSLMAHVQFLMAQERAHLSTSQQNILGQIEVLSQRVMDSTQWSIRLGDTVRALKFVSNEFLLDLVVSGAIPTFNDQRDLLAFTKMEGSSYRCLYEIFYTHRARKP